MSDGEILRIHKIRKKFQRMLVCEDAVAEKRSK